jgi:serine protease AprX
VGADERFTRRGVTIAFLDSGFYPHPDLTQPKNRVLCYTSMGLAPDANVVLVKVAGEHGLHNADIQRGIEWVLEHREKHGIRILNISCAADEEAWYLTDDLSWWAEEAVRAASWSSALPGMKGTAVQACCRLPRRRPSSPSAA